VRAASPGILPIVTIDRASSKPLYQQLYEGYRRAIVERRLRAGQRLPSTRSLAMELQISRIPVLNAFEQLHAEGYFVSRVGSGTYVAASLPEETPIAPRRPASRTPVVSSSRGRLASRATALKREAPPWLKGLGAFHVGQPPLDHFPVKIWSRLVARHSRHPEPSFLHYGSPMGLASLREAVAGYLRTARAVRCEADQILIVNGSQQAIALAAQVLLHPGSELWIEEPGYWGAQNAATLAGARLIPVPVDTEGLNVALGIARCPRPRAVYVTPSHQFPLGVTMSASRRLRLLDWARQAGCWIIEDDYDSEYRYGSYPIASLQGLDQESRVLYIGTFTKIMFPSLRLGYIVLPPDLVGVFEAARRAMDGGLPTFHQSALADFIREGHFERHVRRVRQVCRERRATLVDAIRANLGKEFSVLGDAAGMYLTVTVPRGFHDREISEHAASRGLLVMPLSNCFLEKSQRQGLILGYGGTDAHEIAAGVVQLREIVTPDAGASPSRSVRHALRSASH
jgi:GntR family transcriptional regulator / MocR family aminotransferase